jgi:hypothetical protein
MPAAISGSGGHNATFRVACAAAGVFSLDVEEVYEILVEYNERRVPPWTPREFASQSRGGRPRKELRSILPCGGGLAAVTTLSAACPSMNLVVRKAEMAGR